MKLRNCWYMAGWAKDITPGTIHKITILDIPLAIYRTIDGSIAALEDRCCHRLAPLSIGRIEGDDLRCMYHGLKFAPDGKCNDLPGQDVIPPSVCVRSFPVSEMHGCVWLWTGDRELADEQLIPPIIGPDNPDWSLPTGVIDFEADAALIGDNLLDLSHAPWVHGNSFGAGNKESAAVMRQGEASTKITRLDRGVFLERWHLNRPSNPFLDVGPTDDFIINYFLAPGVFILKTRSYAEGVQQRQGDDQEPLEAPLFARSTCQMITPVNDRQSRFFYTFGLSSNAAEKAQAAFEVATVAFLEDKFFIEEQQAMMERSPGSKVMNLGIDAPLIRYQGILKKLVDAERQLEQAN